MLALQFTTRANDAGWEEVPSMASARQFAGSGVVGGRWYVGGGSDVQNGSEALPVTVEEYDQEANGWSVAGDFSGEWPAAAVGKDVGVLFSGGLQGSVPSRTAILGQGMSWASSAMNIGRYGHSVAFVDGHFVVTGGNGAVQSTTPDGTMVWNTQEDSAEILDPATMGWASAGSMPGGIRIWHTSTALADGHRLLVVGGCLSTGALSTADIYDVRTGVWSKASNMTDTRCGHGAVLLSDGRVLVIGAMSADGLEILPSCEIYDPIFDRWSAVAPMNAPRHRFATVMLPDGRVLVAGGTNDAFQGELGALNSTEIYDVHADSWVIGPALRDARWLPVAGVLSDGVYVAGGVNSVGTPSGKDPSMEQVASTTVLSSAEKLPWSAIEPSSSPSGCGCTMSSDDILTKSATLLAVCLMGISAGRRRAPARRAKL